MFSLKKESRQRQGHKRRHTPVYAHPDLLRTYKSLQVLTISPRICRACRPTPCPHFACNADARASSIAKARRSWGLSAKFCPKGQNRGTAAPKARPLRSSTKGLAVLGRGHGVGRQSRRRRIVARWGALLALGCRQMRGGLAQVLNTRSPVGSLTLPGTRMREC